MQTPAIAPVNQRVRIDVLRAAFLCAIPLILFARPIQIDYQIVWWPQLIEIAGIFLIITGVLGRFWSIIYIGGHKNDRIMQDGPYSICRHPLYLFSVIAATGMGMVLDSFLLALILGGVTFAILSITAWREEAFLQSEFGVAYHAYASRVPRIIPAPRLFRSPAEVRFSVATLRRNFRDALVFLSFIPLAEGVEFLHESSLLWSFPIY